MAKQQLMQQSELAPSLRTYRAFAFITLLHEMAADVRCIPDGQQLRRVRRARLKHLHKIVKYISRSSTGK